MSLSPTQALVALRAHVDKLLYHTSTISPTLLALVAIAASYLAYLLFTAPSALHSPKSSILTPLRSSIFPGLGAIGFYNWRQGFLTKYCGDPHSGNVKPSVRFNIKGHIVVAANGPENGKTFYHTRGLSVDKAYRVMYAGAPVEPTQSYETEDEETQFFFSHLKQSIRAERLRKLLPNMIDICVQTLTSQPGFDTPQGGMINVHDVIFPLVFQLSVRTVGLNEIASDLKRVKEIAKMYWRVEMYSDFVTTHLPFIPLPGIMKRVYGGAMLYRINSTTIQKRVKEGRREDDIVQEMLDEGIDHKKIVLWLITAMFSAVANSSGMASWLFIFIGANQKLRLQMQEHVDETLKRVIAAKGLDYQKMTTSERLHALELEDWEANFQFLDVVLKETIRIMFVDVSLRFYEGPRGGQKPPTIDGEQLKQGDFLAYWTAASHFNPNIFKDPETFDPDRWARGEGKGEFDFLGWGGGLHPCAGMRFAKLEMKVIIATFLSVLDHCSTDLKGNAYSEENLPRVNHDANRGLTRYPSKPIRLSFKKRDDFTR